MRSLFLSQARIALTNGLELEDPESNMILLTVIIHLETKSPRLDIATPTDYSYKQLSRRNSCFQTRSKFLGIKL